nr:MDIS1-interacting receptor like kinase 2-like [Quercus suber]
MVISDAPYFDGDDTYPRDFVNWINGMEQFFEQANWADNKKVRYAKLKLRGHTQRFWEKLEYFRYVDYEPAISVWEDMKEKLCDEYLSPYYRAKYLPQSQSQCGTFQVEANTMNSHHHHPISCPQRTFEQSTKEISTREVTELTVKLMKDIQDKIAQHKKTQSDSIGKPRTLDHNELLATPIEGNIDDDILVVENPPATPKPNVDTDVHASTILEDLHLGEVEEVKTTVLPMVHKVQDEIIQIPHIDFVIPNEFDVVEFMINNNSSAGPLPREIGNLKSLKCLSLQKNNLVGSIPPSLCELGDLTYIDLSQNSLSGAIPQEMGHLKSLVFFQLSVNQLNGSFPTSIRELSQLEIFYVRDNQICGSIPQEVENLMKLTVFRVARNKLTGYLPQNICQNGLLRNLTANVFGIHPNLYYINIANNKLHGEISPNWGKSSILTNLEVGGNGITGSIPSESGDITELNVLDLSSNHLVGEIPMELGRLTSLVKLVLSNNQLSGGIPSEVGFLTNLDYVDLSNNKLSKSIAGSTGNFSHLFHMDLSHNEFSQGIPIEMGMFFQLSILDLSHNS